MITVCIVVIVPVNKVGAESLVDAPQPVLPSNDSWSKSGSITFTWSSVEQADQYELRYIKSDAPCEPKIMTSSDVQNMQVSGSSQIIDGLSDGRWCWQVKAMRNHISSDWSAVQVFKIDTVAPLVTINPSDQSVNFTGTTDTPDLTMTAIVDGTPNASAIFSESADKDELGNYAWHLALSGLDQNVQHTLMVKVADQAGNESTTSTMPFTLLTPASPVNVDTKQAMLPLVDMGPLVFVAPPAPAPLPTSHDKSIVGQQASLLQTPSSVILADQPQAKVSPASDIKATPLQASEQGWMFFGVVWYWWVIGIVAAGGAWWQMSRVRLKRRLVSSLNLSRTVY